MSKREQVVQEIDKLSDVDLETVLVFVARLRSSRKVGDTALASEAVLARDWLTPEEDAAWSGL